MRDRENFAGIDAPLLIAEIGGNHEGCFEYAKKLTREAISTGVDYVKFQLYHNDTIVNRLENRVRYEHFKKFELTKKQHIFLAEMVKDAGIGYMASVWGSEFLDWIDPYMDIYKVGSGDLTAYPLLEKIVKKNKPIILSSGLSNEQDIIGSIEFIQAMDPKYKDPKFLAILQCTSMYPIERKDAHLSVIKRLKAITGLTVGYSDHTVGMDALIYSVLLGAEILEFHFTDNREGKVFRDHKVSLIPEEVLILKDKIVECKELMGNPIKQPLSIEKENNHVKTFRRAVYPSRDIPKGRTLNEEDLIILRPNHGIDARSYYKLIGKKTKTKLTKLQVLSWDFFE